MRVLLVIAPLWGTEKRGAMRTRAPGQNAHPTLPLPATFVTTKWVLLHDRRAHFAGAWESDGQWGGQWGQDKSKMSTDNALNFTILATWPLASSTLVAARSTTMAGCGGVAANSGG